MTTVDQAKEDLNYVANAVRRSDRDDGMPIIYFLWALLVAIGFTLPDFTPGWAGVYWLIIGPAGGILSWWIGTRGSERAGIRDIELGRRYAYHWLLAGLASVLVFVPALSDRSSVTAAASNVLLVIGLAYALAGVHLERPLLWSGVLMFAGYLALTLLAVPYIWTATGLIVAAALVLAGMTRAHPTRG